MNSPSRDVSGAARRPLRADAERNRQRILQAAREVFALRGLEAGLDEIAHHANVGVGTVYRRFPDKQDLIAELFDDRLRAMIAVAQRARARDDAWPALTELIEELAGMHVTDRGLHDLVFTYTGDAFVQDKLSVMIAAISDLMDRAKAHGDLRPDVDQNDIYVLLLMISQTVTGRYTHTTLPWRRYIRLLIDGLSVQRETPSDLVDPAPTSAEINAAHAKQRIHRGT